MLRDWLRSGPSILRRSTFLDRWLAAGSYLRRSVAHLKGQGAYQYESHHRPIARSRAPLRNRYPRGRRRTIVCPLLEIAESLPVAGGGSEQRSELDTSHKGPVVAIGLSAARASVDASPFLPRVPRDRPLRRSPPLSAYETASPAATSPACKRSARAFRAWFIAWKLSSVARRPPPLRNEAKSPLVCSI